MNTSINTTAPDFQDLIYRERLNRLPYSVLVLVLYVIGILGNGLVIFFFCRIQRRKSPSEALILILALCDLITVSLFIAKESERLIFVMGIKSELVCKITHFFGFSAGQASSIFVGILAIYRYRRLYKSNTVQITIKRILMHLILCGLLSVILSLPVPFIVGVQHFQVEGFEIRRCWLDENQLFDAFPIVYIACELVLLSVDCFVLGFCYFRIISVLYQSNIKLLNAKMLNEISNSSMGQTDLNLAATEKEADDVHSRKSQEEKNDKKSPKTTKNTATIIVSQSSIQHPNEVQETTGIEMPLEKDTLKVPTSGENGVTHTAKDDDVEKEALSRSIIFTITILIVSITIMSCYFLFLILYMYMAVKRTDPSYRRMSIREDAFFTYATDIVAMNAVINPFVYFFSDRKYRMMYKSSYKKELKMYDMSFNVGQF